MNEFMRRFLLLPEQASTVARGIDYLHYFVIVTTGDHGNKAGFSTCSVNTTVRKRFSPVIWR